MKKILFYALVGLLLASCDSNDDNNNDELIPINLSSRLTAQSPRLSRQDTQIALGQEVSFFVTVADQINNVVYQNARLIADGQGGFSYSFGESNILYYPVYDNTVDFYAIHPYADITLGETHNFSVLSNQATIRNFLNSDLLFSLKEDVVRSRNAVQLLFDHKLSKVNFVITAGALTSIAGLNNVEIMNVLQETSINTVTGEMGNAGGQRGTITTYGIADGTAEITASQAKGISAIIVPQTFAAGTQLFHLTVDNLEFYYTPSQPITFESGKSYNFILTLTSSGIEVTSLINDWVSTDDTEGEGILE